MASIRVNERTQKVDGVLRINDGVPIAKIIKAMQNNGLDEVLIADDNGNRYLAYGAGIDTDGFAGAEALSPSFGISGNILAVDNEVNTGWEGFKDGWAAPTAMIVGGGALSGFSLFSLSAASLAAGVGSPVSYCGMSFAAFSSLATAGIIGGAVIAGGGVIYSGYKIIKGASADADHTTLFAMGRSLEEAVAEPERTGGGCSASPAKPNQTGEAVDNAIKNAVSEYKYALRQIF